MGITGGFGTMIDLERGTSRQWVMGRDGVKRWADNDQPCAGPAPITLADDSLVDPAIAQVAATLWNEKDGRMCSAVQLLVRPLDVRGDEAGGHPGEEFVMVTITRDELRAMLDFVEEDWRRTIQCAGDPNQK